MFMKWAPIVELSCFTQSRMACALTLYCGTGRLATMSLSQINHHEISKVWRYWHEAFEEKKVNLVDLSLDRSLSDPKRKICLTMTRSSEATLMGPIRSGQIDAIGFTRSVFCHFGPFHFIQTIVFTCYWILFHANNRFLFLFFSQFNTLLHYYWYFSVHRRFTSCTRDITFSSKVYKTCP